MSSQPQTYIHSVPTKSFVRKQNDVLTNVEVSPEQNRYASILLVCSWAGIVVMLITFLIYMGGLFNPLVKPSDMPLYWGLSVHQYLAVTHAPSGWNWLSSVNHSDYLNLCGFSFSGNCLSSWVYFAIYRLLAQKGFALRYYGCCGNFSDRFSGFWSFSTLLRRVNSITIIHNFLSFNFHRS